MWDEMSTQKQVSKIRYHVEYIAADMNLHIVQPAPTGERSECSVTQPPGCGHISSDGYVLTEVDSVMV